MNVLRMYKLLHEGMRVDAWKYKISRGDLFTKDAFHFIAYIL